MDVGIVEEVYFGSLRLARLNERHMRIEDAYGKLYRRHVQPMSSGSFVTYVPGRSAIGGSPGMSASEAPGL